MPDTPALLTEAQLATLTAALALLNPLHDAAAREGIQRRILADAALRDEQTWADLMDRMMRRNASGRTAGDPPLQLYAVEESSSGLALVPVSILQTLNRMLLRREPSQQ
jgi:hypothetical protein